MSGGSAALARESTWTNSDGDTRKLKCSFFISLKAWQLPDPQRPWSAKVLFLKISRMLATRTLRAAALARKVYYPAQSLANTSSLAQVQHRAISQTSALREPRVDSKLKLQDEDDSEEPAERERPEHAVISTFDLFSIGGAYQLLGAVLRRRLTVWGESGTK